MLANPIKLRQEEPEESDWIFPSDKNPIKQWTIVARLFNRLSYAQLCIVLASR
jgi:hypothetical protein